jgi:hypothetical protein
LGGRVVDDVVLADVVPDNDGRPSIDDLGLSGVFRVRIGYRLGELGPNELSKSWT